MTDAFPVERRLPRGELVIALGVLALAGVVYWQSASIPVSPIFAKVGPTVVPYLIAAVLAALGALLVPGAQAQTAADLINDSKTTGDVLVYGMGYNAQRYSPMTKINKSNVKRLVPMWGYSMADNREIGRAHV